MADNTASLVVALSAQLTKFEKDMRDAGIMADKATKDIEDKFSKMNPQVSASFLGNLFSNAATKGIEAASKALSDFYERFTVLRKESSILGESMKDIWGFQEVAKKGGDTIEAATTSLRHLANLLSEMQRGDANSLSALFDANPQALKGVNREALTLMQTVQIVANLIDDTRKGVDKIEVGRLAGLSEDTALSLGKAGTALTGMMQGAAGAAPNLDKMAEQAKAFEGYMAKSYEWLKAMAAISLQGLLSAFSHPVAYTDAQQAALSAGQALQPGSATLKSEAQRAADRAAGRTFGTAADGISGPSGPGTQIPLKATGGSTADAYEREVKAIDKHIAATQAEAATVGDSAYAQEEYRVQLILTEKAVEQYGEVTSKLNDEIALQAERAAQAKQALAEHQFALQRLNAASQAVGSALSTAFADAIVEGKSLNDVMTSLIKTLEKAAINSLVMSFFTPGAGGTTSIFGNLLSGKFAGGTDFAPGGMALVGEHGPELVNLPRGSQVIPNDVARGMGGGGAIVYSPAIDARGASVEAVARLAQIMEQDRATFASRTVATIQSARRGRVAGL